MFQYLRHTMSAFHIQHVVAHGSHQVVAGPLYDLRSPLGVTPAALKALKTAPQAVLQGLKPAKEQGFDAYQSFRKTRASLLKTQNKKRLKAAAVDFKRIWWDKGVRQGSREGAGIWRPVPPEGYFSLGKHISICIQLF